MDPADSFSDYDYAFEACFAEDEKDHDALVVAEYVLMERDVSSALAPSYLGEDEDLALALWNRERALRQAGAKRVRQSEWLLLSKDQQKALLRARLEGVYPDADRALGDSFEWDNRPMKGIAAEAAIFRQWKFDDGESYASMRAEDWLDALYESEESEYLQALEAEIELRAAGKAEHIPMPDWNELPRHTRVELLAQRLEAMGESRESSFALATRTVT